MKKTIFYIFVFYFFMLTKIIIYSNDKSSLIKLNQKIINSILNNKELRLGIWSTWNTKCGIALYTSHIHKAMLNNEVKSFILPFKLPFGRILKRIENLNLNTVNIQYEPSLFSDQQIKRFVHKLKSKNIRVFITVHWEREILEEIKELVDKFIYHKEPTLNLKNFVIVPMGVPVFNPMTDKEQIRKKYGYAKDDLIISTTGFLLPWKEFSDILDKLSPLIKSNPKIKIQLLTSINDVSKHECLNELNKVNEVIEKNNVQNQVNVITKFLPQNELNERLWISDIGYLWGGLNSRGSSASIKEFISSRLPLITTESSHFHDAQYGIIKTPINKDVFVKTIKETLNNIKQLRRLSCEQDMVYSKLNYNDLIKQYIKIITEVNN